MKASDVMSTRVITVPQDMPVEEVARVLFERRISAVPVVDPDANLVGIVSEGDLLRAAESDSGRTGSWWLGMMALPEQYVEIHVQVRGRTAEDVMTREVVSVDENVPIAEIARLLERKRIKRVPVLRDGRVVGIVSRANLLHGLATFMPQEQSGGDDRGAQEAPTLREAIVTAIGREARIDDVFLNVTVADGTVHLWGLVDSESDRKAARAAAEHAAGSGYRIEDHLGITPPYLRSMMWT